MVDINGLKKRIELIDVRMKTAHSARERESDALRHLWDQIHGRFDEQKKEIIQLRSRITELEDVRDDLLQLVQDLLGAVENGLESMNDETVPHIREMADTFLNGNGPEKTSQPAGEPLSHPDIEPSLDANDAQDELLAAIERSLNDADEFSDLAVSEVEETEEEIELETALDAACEGTLELTDPPSDTVTAIASAPEVPLRPVSPGIRSLVERLEGITIQSAAPQDEADDQPEEDDLSRDLREIELLRGELMGLRERIAGER
tara:strand:+ start:249 stop:1034 length:786 start_codon:yes stop_codon:yes gene_type:complete